MGALLTQTVIGNFKNAVPADVIKSVRKVCVSCTDVIKSVRKVSCLSIHCSFGDHNMQVSTLGRGGGGVGGGEWVFP